MIPKSAKVVLFLIGLSITIHGKDSVLSTKPLEKIDVTGNYYTSKEGVLKDLGIPIGDPLNPYLISRAVDKITSMGTYKSVSYQVKEKNDKTTLIFKVEENHQVTEIIITGNKSIKTEKMHPLLTLKAHEIFDYGKLRKDVESIETLYADGGFFRAKIYKIDTPTTQDGPVVFHIGEGTIRELSITGNTKTRTYVILRELTLRPGDTLNTEQVRRSVRNIFNLSYFNNVTPEIIPAEKKNEYDLKLVLDENPQQGSFSVGGGYSPSVGFSLFTDINWNNILGTGTSTMLRANFGIQSAERNNRNASYQFKYHNPWMWSKRKSLTFRSWITNGNQLSILPSSGSLDFIDQQRAGFDVQIGIPHTYYTSSFHTLKYENVELGNPLLQYNIHSYTLGLSYDTRDFTLNPRSGLYNYLSVEQALPINENSLEFTQLDLTLSRFIPTFKDQTIALRHSFGWIRSEDVHNARIFQSQWYYVGGANTIRGYPDLNPVHFGNHKSLFSAEYRFIMSQTLSTVLFVDIGYASFYSHDIYDFSKYKLGKGIGVRFMIPGLGPIRLDFGIDDRGESRIHFNIGQVF